MSAPTCVVFYGLRFEVAAAEIQYLERRTDERVVNARKAGLSYYWGNFGCPGEQYLLFVGARLGVIGPENQISVRVSDEEFAAMTSDVRTKLVAIGLVDSPELHIQWQEDS